MQIEVKKTTHQKKGFEVWVVALTERVSRPKFMELYNKAREVRGWYSSYKANGAIPGFHFKSELAMRQFLDNLDTAGSSSTPPGGAGGSAPKPQPKPQPKPTPAPAPKPIGNQALATRWADLGQSYANMAKSYYEQLKHKQSNTPKRMREYNSKMIDADILTDMATLAAGIAHHTAAGTLPRCLEILQPVKNKSHLRSFVPLSESNGKYYEIHRAKDPWWVPGKHTPDIPGIKSFNQAMEIYNTLRNLNTQSEEDLKQRETQRQIKALEDEVRFAKIDGFFPTPPDLVSRMVIEATIKPSDTVLEPSAGMGSIAEHIRQQHPMAKLITCEINPTLHQILKLKGFENRNDDFLQTWFEADKIIMNPPFERWMDIDHVQHAYQCLNPGGRIVAIMGAGAFNGSTKKHQQFQYWIDNEVNAHYEKLPDGSFKSAFRQTGVATYLVIINK